MPDNKPASKKLSLFAFILMILTTIFGFGNVTVAYYQMGYASIIWYVFAAIAFFLPAGLIFAEYGSSFSTAKGGIYSWLKNSVNEEFAFIGTFIWLASWIVWMISTSSRVLIPLSYIIFGKDETLTFRLFNLFTPTQSVGIIGIVLFLTITFIATRGFQAIARVADVAGVLTLLLPLLFAVMSVIVFIGNGARLAQPIQGARSFIISPNPQFITPIAIMSFIVYAIFGYGGIESMGGVVDKLKRPKRNFPLGIIIAAFTMVIIYALCIFLVGITANWRQVLGTKTTDLGNITFVLMSNLGYVFTKTFGFSNGMALLVGRWLARLTGILSFVPLLGAFFVLVYSPIKSFIEGSDPQLWPRSVRKLNQHGMPSYAMWLQAAIVVLVIFFIAFSGNGAQNYYLILTNMTNISTTAPYLFLVGAFPFFKRLSNVERPFVFFKSKRIVNVVVATMLLVLVLGIGFTALQPILLHDYVSAFWTIIGPIVFASAGWLLYQWGKHCQLKN